MAKKTNKTPKEPSEGTKTVDNTESSMKAPVAAAKSEEYELTPGLKQVNYQ